MKALIQKSYGSPLNLRTGELEKPKPKANEVLLVIEVADSSLEYDRNIKLPLYAQSGIPEYWLVNLEKEEIEAYWQPYGETYKFRELLGSSDVLRSRHLELEIPVADILPLSS